MKNWPLATALTMIEAEWAAEAQAGLISEPTLAGYLRTLDAFRKFATAHEASDLQDVNPRLCQEWINAPLSPASPQHRTSRDASSATKRTRQTVLRRAVSVWLEKGMIWASPVAVAVIRPEPSRGALPLTPLEVSQLRLHGQMGTRDTIRPAIVEAALAGASQQSIALLTVTSFDATQGVLRIPGSRQTYERDLQLGASASAALQALVADLARSASRRHVTFDPTSMPLLVRGTSEPSQSAHRPQVVASHLKRALAAAGLNRPGVTAGSAQAFAANCRYARTNRVEDVAELLGLHSLDRAMAKIDHQWQSAWAEKVRNLGDC